MTTYWVILGKHLDISRAEIFAHGFSIKKHYNQQVAILENNDEPELVESILSRLWGIVKRWVVVWLEEIQKTDLVGVSNRELGAHLKKNELIKRYKEIDLLHTDTEIQNLQSEYVQLDNDFHQILHITHYQNIDRFSKIDFDKPVNSMQIGMMPSKLTQIMVNIWVGKTAQWDGTTTIYDPFMGLGTTYMIANSMWYNVIGSDINITPAKQNLPWRKEQSISQDLPITLFLQDATQSLNKPFLKHVTCIVTEWWLGHIITAKTRPLEIELYSQEIQKLYIAWINNMFPLWEHMKIVCAIPHHTWGDNKHVTAILHHCEKKGIKVETIPQVYTRSGQKVWRKIVILSW